jgi:hypothetical protein
VSLARCKCVRCIAILVILVWMNGKVLLSDVATSASVMYFPTTLMRGESWSSVAHEVPSTWCVLGTLHNAHHGRARVGLDLRPSRAVQGDPVGRDERHLALDTLHGDVLAEEECQVHQLDLILRAHARKEFL